MSPAEHPHPLQYVNALNAALQRLIVRLSAVALLLAALVMTYGVVSRYFFNAATDWQDEISVFLIVGAMFLSAAQVQSVRGHVAIDALAAILPVRANRLRQWVADLVSALFCGFFSWKSWTLFDEALTEGYRTSSNWAPPQWIPYSLMALGMSLLTVQIVLQLMPGTAPDRVNEGHA